MAKDLLLLASVLGLTLSVSLAAGSSTAQQLEDAIEAKELALSRLQKVAEVKHSDRCSALSGCECSYPACANTFPSAGGFHCNGTFGLDDKLCGKDCVGLIRSMHSTVVRFPPEVDFKDAEVQSFVCSTKGMDSNFRSAFGAGDLKAWSYIGHNSGSIRIYPGAPQGRSTTTGCGDYDARLRPWFIAASSGPKDIVIVIDRSRSMAAANDLLEKNGESRIQVVRAAVRKLLGTLTQTDYVSVIAFGSKPVVLGTRTPTTLLRATDTNIADLDFAVENLIPTGSTNMAPAFTKAFDVLAGKEETSGCTKVILFLTDGVTTDDPDKSTASKMIMSAIEAGQKKLTGAKAHIFTYSMSSQADHDVPRAIACANNGIWSPIASGEDPLNQMRAYYQFLAAGIVSDSVRWTAPYTDAFGLGEMVTAAKAVYDRSVSSVPVMVGVIGTDITMSELDGHGTGSSHKTIINELMKRSQVCPTVNLSACEMQHLRKVSEGSYTCPNGPSLTTGNCTNEVSIVKECTTTKNLNNQLCEALNEDTRTVKSGSVYSDEKVTCCTAGQCSSGSGDDEEEKKKAKKEEEKNKKLGGTVGALVGIVAVMVILAVIVACYKRHSIADSNRVQAMQPQDRRTADPARPGDRARPPNYTPNLREVSSYPAFEDSNRDGATHFPPPPLYGDARQQQQQPAAPHYTPQDWRRRRDSSN